MKLPLWMRVAYGALVPPQIWLAWTAAQVTADWAADGKWYWPVAVGGVVGWLFWAYEDASRAIAGRWSA